jgi:hypothetical protein
MISRSAGVSLESSSTLLKESSPVAQRRRRVERSNFMVTTA